jgi:hypothetical protein
MQSRSKSARPMVGGVEDWRRSSVGPAYPLLPVSVGSASLAGDPPADGAKPEGTYGHSCGFAILG